MYATEDVRDALEATKGLLLPFEFRHWLAVGFVTFFLGGAGFNFSSPSVVTGGGEVPPAAPPPEAVPVLAGLVAVALLVGLAFAAVRAVMDLVLVEVLREERVELRRFWTTRWRQGLGLFGFRLAVTTVALVVVGLPFALVFLGADGGGELVALGFLLLVPVLLVVPPTLALLKGFTTAFVAPVMVLEDASVLGGWRRFWATLRAEWTEFLGYAVVNLALVAAAVVLLVLGAAVGALLLLVPFAPLFGVGAAAYGAFEPAGAALLGLSGLAYGAAAVVLAAFVKAPVLVFLRYYALFVLGDADADLDLVPVIRREVRADGE